jgi:hypothetical protein
MRDAYGRFVPGVSGNPGGRPRGAYALREQVRTMTPELVKELFAIALDSRAPAGARVKATAVLLDRGFGRPARAEPIPAATDDLSKLSDAELIELIATEQERERAEAEADAATR